MSTAPDPGGHHIKLTSSIKIRSKAVQPCQFCPLIFNLPCFARVNSFNFHLQPQTMLEPRLTTTAVVQEFLVLISRDIELLPRIINYITVYEISYSFLSSTPFVSENCSGRDHGHV